MSGWRWNSKVAAAMVVLFLAIQLTLPTVLLLSTGDTSQRFGWQMFSQAAPDPGFVVVTESGERQVPLDEVLARPRADLDLVELVPPFLCSTVPGVVRVTWSGGSLEC